MSKDKETQAAPTPSAFNFAKINRRQVSLKKELKGILVGAYQGLILKEIMDKRTRVSKEVNSYNFDLIDEKTGEVKDKITVLGDAGLKSEITNADLKEGDIVKIVHIGEKDLGNGQKVNQYDIFRAS